MDFRPIYLYKFKLDQAAAKTSRKINEAFGQGSTNKRTVQRWFQKFRNEDISLQRKESSRGVGSTNKRTVQRWFQKFRNGDISLQRKESSRGVSILENEKLKRMVERNPSTTVQELAGKLILSVRIVSNYLKDINIKKKKWILTYPMSILPTNVLEACKLVIL
uniref:HTH_48 domain-containing protein n=1 Tax=Strongyloides papillosus TaxID=174720 RepID=A0A0N5B4K4_STREA